jgi:Domain of unknown function (DUF1906)
MKRGISTNRNLSESTNALNENDVDFVFRYYSQTTHQPQKRLTRAEAEALSSAGLVIGVVYEDNPTAASYFSNTRGHQDAVNAYNAALALHQPVGSAIYFAVDFDASLSDISGSILDYFNGVRRGFSDAAQGDPNYTIGVYGSGATCNFLKSQCSFVKYGWLAESTGWRGSQNYAKWDVKQSIARNSLGGLQSEEYEENDAQDDFGGFTLQN